MDATDITFLLVTAFLAIFFLGLFVLWFWALIDCLRHEPSENNSKLIWTLIILFTNLIGVLVYLFLHRPKRKQKKFSG